VTYSDFLSVQVKEQGGPWKDIWSDELSEVVRSDLNVYNLARWK
jgi:hypothetical protein